jgi:hypothetical protein
VTNLSKQMSFDWDLPEEESNSALSADEIQLRKDVAKIFIEDPVHWEKNDEGKPIKPYWFDRYINLHEGNARFPFRVAVLTAWLETPKKYRYPKTQDELAEMLGMSSDRQFSVWMAKNPQIRAVVHNSWHEKIMDHLNDSVNAMLEVAAEPDYKGRGDRELHFKLAKILSDSLIVNNAGNVDLNKLPFQEKWKLAGLDTPEGQEKLRQELAKAQPIVESFVIIEEGVENDVHSNS